MRVTLTITADVVDIEDHLEIDDIDPKEVAAAIQLKLDANSASPDHLEDLELALINVEVMR